MWSDSNQKGTAKLNFAESQNKDDEKTYTLSLSAQYSSYSGSLVSATGTYKYIGCSQADIKEYDIPDYSVEVGNTQTGMSALWYAYL